MDKENAINEMKRVLKPFALHDLPDVCEQLYLDFQNRTVHPATLLCQAVENLQEPLGGEDGFGDLSWRIGPHPWGLPHLRVRMEYDGEVSSFTTKFPQAIEQIQADYQADAPGDKVNGVVDEYLSAQLDDDDREAVWAAIVEDAAEVVRNIEAAHRIAHSPEVQNLLVDAIQKGNGRGMDAALSLGAQVNEKDEQGHVPLHHAVLSGHHQFILPLLHAGARVDEVNKMGQSALHLAATNACAHSCLVLLAHNADPKLKDRMGRTPIPEPFMGYRYEPSL